MKRIGLIFDSDYIVGGGHFWRCFNLAKSLKKNKYKFFFISNTLNKNFVNVLNREKFKYIKSNNLNNEKEIILKITNLKLDVLISDYYNLKSQTKKKIKKYLKLLVVIDDFIHKKHFSDVYINNNFLNTLSKKKIKRLNPNTKLFLGPKYFILDKLFVKTKKKKNKKKITNIFCFFGSSDPSNQTFKFLNSIKNLEKIKINVLVGKLNKNFKNLKKLFMKKKILNFFITFLIIESFIC